jgi:translation initiation factor IF-3
VIDETGQQLGIMPPPQAVAIARQKGLDLVEVSPTAVPPVCRIMDFGKYQYQEQKRSREAKKHQRVIEVKEIKSTSTTTISRRSTSSASSRTATRSRRRSSSADASWRTPRSAGGSSSG